MTAGPRVVCAGLATVDLVYRVDRVPGADEKAQAEAMEIAAGGPAANAAVTAAALGARVTLVTAVGAHPLGDLIRSDLGGYGVTLLDAAPGHPGPPPVSAVTVESGTGRRTIVSRNAADATVEVPPGLADVLAEADVVLVDGHHPALAVAAARGARRLVVDAGSWRPVFADLLPHADVVACSAAFRHPDATAESHPGAPAKGRPSGPADSRPRPTAESRAGATADGSAATAILLRDLGVPHVAVTCGPEPVRWWSGPGSGRVPVPPVAAVDTAGAGDVFHGALAVAVARDPEITDLPAALRFATRVAGMRVQHPGPRRWLRALQANG